MKLTNEEHNYKSVLHFVIASVLLVRGGVTAVGCSLQ